MKRTASEQNKTLVLKAFDTLFNKRDYASAERLWSPHYIQHSCVYRKPKLCGSGDGVRPGWGTSLGFRPTEPGEIRAHPYPRPSASASHYSNRHMILEPGADAPRRRQ